MKARIEEPARLDIIAGETMGKTGDGAVEALLAANPGLADGGPWLDAPKDIVIPLTPPKPAIAGINPWD